MHNRKKILMYFPMFVSFYAGALERARVRPQALLPVSVLEEVSLYTLD